MHRGFLAARIDVSNPHHHLWCNNGSWWVHYTLHFDERKRRIRRSLNTSDVRVAIVRRDALFARLTTEGEDVPERPARRRRTANDERPMLVPSTPPTPYEDFRTMAHQPANRSRRTLIIEADCLFAQAKSLVASAQVSLTPHRFWRRAAQTFEDAANHYREAGLGVMARVLYGYASDCFGEDGRAEESSRCKTLAESVQTDWEVPTDE